MQLPQLKVEPDGIAVHFQGARVIAIDPSSKRISIGDQHIVINGKDAAYKVTVPGVGSYSIINDGTGRITISQLGGFVSASISYSTATGEVLEISLKLEGKFVYAGAKLGTTLETSLRPISFNNQIIFNGSFTAEVSIFGKSIYSQTKSRPIGLHDSIDALSVLSIGFLDPNENANIKAFLERLKRTKEGDLPGMSSLTREELAALLALIKRGQAVGA